LCNGVWGHRCETSSMKYTYVCLITRLKGRKVLGPHSFERVKIYYSCGTHCYMLFMGIRSWYSDSKGRKGERIRSSSGNNIANVYAVDIPSVSRTNYQVFCWTFFLVLVLQNIFKAIVGIILSNGPRLPPWQLLPTGMTVFLFIRTLHGCETLSLTIWEERKLRLLENRVLRRIFGPRRGEVTG
jgi:hypothetical protein